MSAEKPEQCKLCQGSKVVGIGLPCLCTMSYPSEPSTPEAATDAGDLHDVEHFLRNEGRWLYADRVKEMSTTIAALRREVERLQGIENKAMPLMDEMGVRPTNLEDAMKMAVDEYRKRIAAERELAELKRGEFICKRCGIRKDGEIDQPIEF